MPPSPKPEPDVQATSDETATPVDVEKSQPSLGAADTPAAATPADQPPADKPSPGPVEDDPPVDGEDSEPHLVRLVPADSWTDSIELTGLDGERVHVSANRPGYAPYLIDAADADEMLTLAAAQGTPLAKEIVR